MQPEVSNVLMGAYGLCSGVEKYGSRALACYVSSVFLGGSLSRCLSALFEGYLMDVVL